MKKPSKPIVIQPQIMCAKCRQMIVITKLNKHIEKDHGEEKQGKAR